jgi:light-regulated signal transduction histidine kinase (bacteriophytochrome)
MVRDFLQELITLEPDRQVDFVIEENVSVHADARLIRIAMVNLLRNAWKFTAKGEKALIEFGTDHENGEKVFFIRDNGVGFDMRFAEKIFEPFQRVHSDREFKGTGVGLSIVWRVVNRHGGRVWAMSEPEKGAVFYFTLGDK